MRTVTIALGVAVTLLAACSTRYAPSIDDRAAARIRFVVTYPDHTWVSALKKDCFTSTIGTETLAVLMRSTLREPQRVSIGMPLDELPIKARFRERSVPAGSPINIAFFGHSLTNPVGGESWSCAVAVRLVPAVGADYEMKFTQIGDQCRLSVDQLRTISDGHLERTPVQEVTRLNRC